MSIIDVKNLDFTYPHSEAPTLRDLSFDVEQGEIFGFLGPSGSGKSTTQKILYKLLKDYTGTVHVLGKRLSDWSDAYYKKIGVGFELPNHYLKLTGRENIELFASFYGSVNQQRMKDLFEELELLAAIDQRVENYSKGMKMRLNFIRAIMHEPSLLFLDEPTAGLDPINASKIKLKIRELQANGTTIFLTTHNMNTADELCDRVSFIVNGRLCITDSPQVLKEKSSVHEVVVTFSDGEKQTFALADIGRNEHFLAALKSHEVKAIHTTSDTLESVFLKLTGQALKR